MKTKQVQKKKDQIEGEGGIKEEVKGGEVKEEAKTGTAEEMASKITSCFQGAKYIGAHMGIAG